MSYCTIQYQISYYAFSRKTTPRTSYILCLFILALPACALFDGLNGEAGSDGGNPTQDAGHDAQLDAELDSGEDVEIEPDIGKDTDSSGCAKGEAGPDGIDCETCPPGSYCEGGVAPRINCADEFAYDHDDDPTTSCVAWSTCTPGQTVSSQGSSTEDRTCAPCQAGTYSAQSNTDSCIAWKNCDPGHFVATHPSATAQRECEPCPDGGDTLRTNAAACHHDWNRITAGDFPVCRWTDEAPGFECTDPDIDLDANAGEFFDLVAAGGREVCGIRHQDSRAVCRGRYTNAGNTPVGSRFKYLAVGPYHACGIRLGTSTLKCWGEERNDQFSNTPNGEYKSVSVGPSNSCAIRQSDSYAICWGMERDSGKYTKPNAFRSLSVDAFRTCGVLEQGSFVDCWARDGQNITPPAPFGSHGAQDAETFDSVFLGPQHICGIRASDSSLICASWNTENALPNTLLPANRAFDAVAVSREKICALPSGNPTEMECWDIPSSP